MADNKMSDDVVELEQDVIAEPLPSRPTKRDLMRPDGLDKLDTNRMMGAKISAVAGGVSFSTSIEVMDMAKAISTGGIMLPDHLRGNPGACLIVMLQAIEWGMSIIQVIGSSFVVNNRTSYSSQLLHAVVERRAALQHRLDCSYDGDGLTRSCTVTGMFTNGDIREYTSPQIKDIRIKNSPLWKDDPDQQLFYYASRAWARKWVPDVLMGIYTREELAADPTLGREEDSGPSLSARLKAGTPLQGSGYDSKHIDSELDAIAPPKDIGVVIDIASAATTTAPKKNKRTSELPKGKAKAAKEPEQPKTKLPKTAAQYLKYAENWIADMDTAEEIQMRWADERQLRNDLGVTADDRAPLDEQRFARMAKLEGCDG